MGVTNLWSILLPVKKHRTLEELKGETLAVDLSVWVCETQGVKQMQGTVTKPYLRNLFFRVSHLTQLGVKLVFAIEGKAPDLKWETMANRQQARKGYKGQKKSTAPGKCKSRSHFNALLKECCEMLDYLGIPYVHSCGEAEALCALLNQEGIADACLTQDGDAFLYGARKVYRNFTMNTKDPHVESYDMADIEQDLCLDRSKLVGLGLLLGCDYVPKGVPGVGEALAMKFMKNFSQYDVLQRFKDWKSDKSLKLMGHCNKKPTHCTVCGHIGSSTEHKKTGCRVCGSSHSCDADYGADCTCDWHLLQKLGEGAAAEQTIMHKATADAAFPNQQIIEEYLVPKDKVKKTTFVFRRPQINKLQVFNEKKLEWPVEYTLEKVLPLVTIWDMRDILRNGGVQEYNLKPNRIVKARVRQKVPCFEIEWLKDMPTVESEEGNTNPYFVTVEEQIMFKRCFPTIAKMYEDEKAARRDRPKKKGKKKAGSDGEQEAGADLIGRMSELSIAGQDTEDRINNWHSEGAACGEHEGGDGKLTPQAAHLCNAGSSVIVLDDSCCSVQGTQPHTVTPTTISHFESITNASDEPIDKQALSKIVPEFPDVEETCDACPTHSDSGDVDVSNTIPVIVDASSSHSESTAHYALHSTHGDSTALNWREINDRLSQLINRSNSLLQLSKKETCNSDKENISFLSRTINVKPKKVKRKCKKKQSERLDSVFSEIKSVVSSEGLSCVSQHNSAKGRTKVDANLDNKGQADHEPYCQSDLLPASIDIKEHLASLTKDISLSYGEIGHFTLEISEMSTGSINQESLNFQNTHTDTCVEGIQSKDLYVTTLLPNACNGSDFLENATPSLCENKICDSAFETPKGINCSRTNERNDCTERSLDNARTGALQGLRTTNESPANLMDRLRKKLHSEGVATMSSLPSFCHFSD